MQQNITRQLDIRQSQFQNSTICNWCL